MQKPAQRAYDIMASAFEPKEDLRSLGQFKYQPLSRFWSSLVFTGWVLILIAAVLWFGSQSDAVGNWLKLGAALVTIAAFPSRSPQYWYVGVTNLGRALAVPLRRWNGRPLAGELQIVPLANLRMVGDALSLPGSDGKLRTLTLAMPALMNKKLQTGFDADEVRASFPQR